MVVKLRHTTYTHTRTSQTAAHIHTYSYISNCGTHHTYSYISNCGTHTHTLVQLKLRYTSYIHTRTSQTTAHIHTYSYISNCGTHHTYILVHLKLRHTYIHMYIFVHLKLRHTSYIHTSSYHTSISYIHTYIHTSVTRPTGHYQAYILMVSINYICFGREKTLLTDLEMVGQVPISIGPLSVSQVLPYFYPERKNQVNKIKSSHFALTFPPLLSLRSSNFPLRPPGEIVLVLLCQQVRAGGVAGGRLCRAQVAAAMVGAAGRNGHRHCLAMRRGRAGQSRAELGQPAGAGRGRISKSNAPCRLQLGGRWPGRGCGSSAGPVRSCHLSWHRL